MNENFKVVSTAPTTAPSSSSYERSPSFEDPPPLQLTKREVGDDDEHVLWEKNESSILTTDNMCGAGGCRGPFIQKFADRRVFLLVFCILAIVQGMFYTYTVSVLTTIEKRFALPSRIIGFLMTANEFSQIIFAIVIAYYGSVGHRPRWIAAGLFASAFACFICILPEFTIDVPLPHMRNMKHDMCAHVNTQGINGSVNQDVCTDDADPSSRTAAALIFVGLFIAGFGSIVLYSLGLPYMDDNTSKKSSPIYIGFFAGLRMAGPLLGFLLGSYSTSRFVKLEKTPEFGPDDRRWVGAWWLGFIIMGLVSAIAGFLVGGFPKILPATLTRNQKKNVSEECCLQGGNPSNGTDEDDFLLDIPSIPRFSELAQGLGRLLSNSLFIIYGLSGIFHIIGTFGFITFLPKYLETQFKLSAPFANTIAGLAGFLVMMLSVILSGLIIERIRPTARLVSAWITCISCIQFILMVISMYISCEQTSPIQGIIKHGGLDLTNDCNAQCHCSTQKFNPVCEVQTQLTYFSPCHLGCSSFNMSTQEYENCSCAAPSLASNSSTPFTKVVLGMCNEYCGALLVYVTVLAVMQLTSSSCRVGSILVILRAVEPRDKGLAMGLLSTVYCLLAFLPCTIVFGAAVDSTCIVWEETCGHTGNCWVYDANKLRRLLHGLSATFIGVATVFDAIFCLKSKHLILYEANALALKPVRFQDVADRNC